MPSAPKLDQPVIPREDIMRELEAVLARHDECKGYRVDAVQVFAPGLIIGTNWRIGPPLNAQGERERSPCWLAVVEEVKALQKRYKAPWP
jgi:hypothetical protein